MIQKSPLRGLFWILPLFYFFLPAPPLHAKSICADINDMHIDIIQPWYLVTHGDTRSERLYFMLMKAFKDGGAEEIGTGWAAQFTAKNDMPFMEADTLKHLNAMQLQTLVRDFEMHYLKFSEPDTEFMVTENNGFTMIVQKKKQKGTEETPAPGYEVTYYFPLRDKLTVLYASVYGSPEDANIMKNICASFVPHVTAKRENSSFQSGFLDQVVNDGIRLTWPRDWSALVTGTGNGEKVWGRVSRFDMNDKILAEVIILSPVLANSFIGTQSVEQRLRNSEQDHSIFSLSLRGRLENTKVTEKKTVTVNGLPATLTTVSGKINNDQVIIEFRDIFFEEKVVTLVTGYPKPLPESVRKQLEVIYNLFSLDKQL